MKSKNAEWPRKMLQSRDSQSLTKRRQKTEGERAAPNHWSEKGQYKPSLKNWGTNSGEEIFDMCMIVCRGENVLNVIQVTTC